MNRLIAVCFVMLTLLGRAWGSMKAYDPFEHMKSATIEIMIGDQTDATGESSERLFYNDHQRQHRFKEALAKAVSDRLGKSGIRTDPNSTGAVLIGMWGHSIPARDCGLDFVFTIEFAVFAEENSHPAACEGASADRSASVIGAASDQRLEQVLTDAVMRLLNDDLRGIDYAAQHPPQLPVNFPGLDGVSIDFDHLGGRVEPLDLHMGETGEPGASSSLGDDLWLRLTNDSKHTISFSTYSMYVRDPAAQLFTLESGKRVLALENGMEISIAYGLLNQDANVIPYSAIDMTWVSFLPPGRSVIFNVPRSQLATAASLFVQFTAVGLDTVSTYRSTYPISDDQRPAGTGVHVSQ